MYNIRTCMIYIYVYIYIYTERERERDHMYICIHIWPCQITPPICFWKALYTTVWSSSQGFQVTVNLSFLITPPQKNQCKWKYGSNLRAVQSIEFQNLSSFPACPRARRPVIYSQLGVPSNPSPRARHLIIYSQLELLGVPSNPSPRARHPII